MGAAIPYLNAELGDFEYFKDLPAGSFRVQVKIITVHPRQIAVNVLRDATEAAKIVQWLQWEIDETWEKGERMNRSTMALRPKVLEVL